MPNVNRSFMKDLKLMDKRLNCFFHPETEKFIVTYERAMGGSVPIATLAGVENGVFRQPYARDLAFIKSGDMTNTTIERKLDEVSAHMEFEREEQRRKTHENFRDRTKDDKLQLQSAFQKANNLSKSNSAFRRI